MAAISQRHVELARSLPPKLLSFFARHPPAALRLRATSDATTSTDAYSSTSSEPSTTLRVQPGYEKPFEITQNPITGKWRDPVYSLRRQADLSKLARAHGVEELLPFTVKSFDERLKRRQQHGMRMKGTGVGQKVKGHWWERTMRTRLESRRQAMRDMPDMVRKWKQLGHGRGWKNWPK